ncbi:MAG: ABC-F family ATP-binding cassette domain-containing protein [archaeon]|nr:ABC-F family ATP-binding cassette domain-containing protein [archaeon]
MISLHNISFEVKSGNLLLKEISISFGSEKSGLVGKNGAGKTTLLKLMMGQLECSSGKIDKKAVIGYLPQDYQFNLDQSIADTLGISDKLEAMDKISVGSKEEKLLNIVGQDWDIKDRALGILHNFGLKEIKFNMPLKELSGGERMKVALASLLVWNANFLIMDEPTNNLDYSARQVVYNLIKDWTGGLLVVSHDRELLNLMNRILELNETGLKIYGGNYNSYVGQRKVEIDALHRQLSDTKNELRKIKRQAQTTKEKQEKRTSRGKKLREKTGMPKMELGKMKETGEKTSSRLKLIHDLRIKNIARNLAKAKEQISPENIISVDLSHTKVPQGKLVSRLEDVSFHYPHSDKIILENLNLIIHGPSRISIDGPNGSGKTTLVKVILGKLKPSSGKTYLGLDNVAYLDQGVEELDKNKTLLDNLKKFYNFDNTNARKWLGRFLFYDKDVFKEINILSGGERIKATLACILAGDKPPQLLALDEPTNNLDLDSIEQIESALSNFKGTLIVISHDKRFMANIGIERSIKLSYNGS